MENKRSGLAVRSLGRGCRRISIGNVSWKRRSAQIKFSKLSDAATIAVNEKGLSPIAANDG